MNLEDSPQDKKKIVYRKNLVWNSKKKTNSEQFYDVCFLTKRFCSY